MTVAVVLALGGLLGWIVSLYIWPFSPCRKCSGSGRNTGSNRKRFGRCRRCKGSGTRERLGYKQVHRSARAARARRK